MKTLDILFVHPPANINGSNHTLDADTNFTEQYVSIPSGVFSMADNVDKAGYSVRILNLGERIHLSGNLLENEICKILTEFQPKVVGIDCHWMIHSAGAIETARLFKKYSPETCTVLGGITASYFADEINRNYAGPYELSKYCSVNFVMKGECDEAIVQLLDAIIKGSRNIRDVDNITMRISKYPYFIENLANIPNVSSTLETTRYDLLIDPPIINSDRAIITMFRGCKNNCCYCTGAKKSFGDVMQRNNPCIIDHDRIIDLMQKNLKRGRDKIYLYGDIRHGGEYYVKRFFQELALSDITNAHIVFEFFSLATEEYLAKWRNWADKNSCTLEATYSPESGNRKIRAQFSKGYTNEKILNHCKLVTSYGIPQSTYFMFGLPEQDLAEVEETLQLAEKIIRIYVSAGFNRKSVRHDVIAYTFMQIPDAGSELFKNPEKYGFHLHFNGFRKLVKMLSSAQNWTEAIGYHTNNFTTEQLVETYKMIMHRMHLLYKKYGL